MSPQMKIILKNVMRFILIVGAAYFILPVSLPILLAILTAFLIEPLVIYILKTLKCSRKVGVSLLHLIFYTFTLIFMYFSINILIKQVIALSKALPHHINTLLSLYIELQTKVFNWTSDWPIEVVEGIQTSLQQQLTDLSATLIKMTEFENYVELIKATPNVLFTLFVYFTVLFLIQLQLPKLQEQSLSFFNPTFSEKVQVVFGELKIATWGFFKAQAIISGIIFIVTLPALFFLLPKYALLLTLAIVFVDAIPFLDSFILLAPLALILYASNQTKLAISLLVLGIVLLLIRRFLEPKILGKEFDLPTLPTFIAMYIGFELIGVLGLLAGPLFVILIRALIKHKLFSI